MFANRLRRDDNQAVRRLAGFFGASPPPEQYSFRPLSTPAFRSAPGGEQQHNVSSDDRHPAEIDLAFNTYQPPQPAPVVTSEFADVPLANRMLALDWQRRQQQLVATINAAQPKGCHVMAYCILPTDLFAGEVGRFLILACDFYSHGFSNTLLLPTTPTGAAHFKLPQHPIVTPDMQLLDAKARTTQLRTRVANEHNRVASALSRGDVSALFKPNATRPNYKHELVSICRSVAINAIGLSAYVTHESLFNTALRSAED